MSSENKASIKETDKLIVITGNKTSEGIVIKKNALIGYQITGGPPESITLILSHLSPEFILKVFRRTVPGRDQINPLLSLFSANLPHQTNEQLFPPDSILSPGKFCLLD